MQSKNYTPTSVFLFVIIFSTVQITFAKSLYVISNTETSQLQAYEVQDTNLVLQINYVCEFDPPDVIGSVGLAIDESQYGQFLFVTFEGQNLVEIVNAKTMQFVDTVTAAGASGLAGIVVDQNKSKVYTMDRWTSHLYSYSWNPLTKMLIPDFNDPYYIELDDLEYGYPEGAFGIALDEENSRLYVADNTDEIKYYDTNDWSHDPNTDYITVSCNVISIAIDVNEQLLYYSSIADYGQGDTHLYKYNISSETEGSVNVGCSVAGIVVDQATGLIYLTTYIGGDYYFQDPPWDRLMIYDSNLAKQPWESGDIGNPAGVAVGSTAAYKPPAFYLEKVDVNEPNCVLPGDYITYRITYGPNGIDHNNVIITDYLPCQVDYINPFDPNYDPNRHTYTWQIGSLSASAPNDFVTLTVNVNLGVEPNGIITNCCEIESDHYCSFASADTIACFWSPDIIYVDVNAVGCNSGLSWYHADPNLQRALQKAQAWDVNQIWVARGTYKPTMTSDRAISFELLDNVAIYGGFAGTESHPNQRYLTDPDNKTILSGDIGAPIDQNGNSYHVVKCVDVNNAILDGFTITAGNANAYYPDEPNRYGGGIYCYNSSVIKLANCTIIQNEGVYGGGIYNYNCSSLMIKNCSFRDNSAFYGGTLYNDYSSSDVNITNCNFTGNTAFAYGGGMYNYLSSPTIINCSFTLNTSTNQDSWGGGMYNEHSSPTIINCTFSGNSMGRLGRGGAI